MIITPSLRQLTALIADLEDAVAAETRCTGSTTWTYRQKAAATVAARKRLVDAIAEATQPIHEGS